MNTQITLKYCAQPMISLGLANSHDPTMYNMLVKYDPEKSLYKTLSLKENVKVGMTLAYWIKHAGTLFHPHENHVNMEKFKQDLLSETFGLTALPLVPAKSLPLAE